jgi:sensor domain CHASE-containing protein
MEDWTESAILLVLMTFSATLTYTIVHMIYNRLNGKDELENLFRFKKLFSKRKL